MRNEETLKKAREADKIRNSIVRMFTLDYECGCITRVSFEDELRWKLGLSLKTVKLCEKHQNKISAVYSTNAKIKAELDLLEFNNKLQGVNAI